MTNTIEYFYTHISPWAYLGHAPFASIAKAHGVDIRLRPVDLSGVFSETGGLPLGKRHPARQAYRFIEMQRWKDHRGVPLTFKPKFFPTSPKLADCCAVALGDNVDIAMEFTAQVFKAIWVDDLDIADRGALTKILGDLGLSAEEVLGKAESADVEARYAQNQQDAIALGVVGSPNYVLKGEPFWGQDRLELLEEALGSGRAAYGPL